MSNLIKNIKLSLITYLSQIISGSVVYIVLARVMSLNDFGLLSFGTTLAGLLTVTSEFGYALMAERDISQKKFPLSKYIVNAFIQKFAFSTLSIIGGLIYLFTFYSGTNVTIGIIFIVNAILSSNNIYFMSVFRANNKFKVEAIITMLYALILVLMIICFFAFKLDLIFIAFSLLFARFVQLITLVVVFIRKFGAPKLAIDKDIQFYFIKNSYSFGVQYIIGIFYFSFDSQLIAYYSGNDALAVYQAFFKIVLILLSFSDLLNNVFLPYLSSKFKNNNQQFLSVTKIANKTAILVGLGLFVFLNLFAKDIVSVLYTSKYLSALKIVVPLSFVLLFRVMCSIYAIILTISDRQKIRVLIVFITFVLNITLNFWLIPKFGFIGAAYVSLVTHLVLLTLYVFFSYKYLNSFFMDTITKLYLIGTIGLVVMMQIFHIEFNFLNSCAVMICWLISLFMIIDKEQYKEVKEVFRGGYL
jgi:O-antigen/teichoic acid export membrane protein